MLRYAAIGTENGWTVRAGLRGVGEPLFPKYKSLEFLNERRRMYTQAGWESPACHIHPRWRTAPRALVMIDIVR